MLDHLAAQQPGSELHSLRLALASLAADADVVLDLHCDDQALMHLFLIPAHWPAAADLAADLGCRAVLLAEDSGGRSEEHTSELQSLMRHSDAVFCLKKKTI